MSLLSDHGDQFGGFSGDDIERLFVPPPGGWPACMNLPKELGHFLRVFALNNFDRSETEKELRIDNAKLRNTVSRLRRNLPNCESVIPTTALWQVNQCLPVFLWLFRQVDAVYRSPTMLRTIADRCKKLADPLLQHFMDDIYGRLDPAAVPANFRGLTDEEVLVERSRLLIDAGEAHNALPILNEFSMPDRTSATIDATHCASLPILNEFSMPDREIRPDHSSFWGVYQRGIAFKVIRETERAMEIFEHLRRMNRRWREPFKSSVFASVLNQIGETLLVRYDERRDERDLDSAEKRFQEATSHFARIAFSHRIAFSLSNLGHCARLRSEELTAGFYYELAADVFSEFGLRRYVERMERECAALDRFSRHSELEIRSYFGAAYGRLQPWMIRIGRPVVGNQAAAAVASGHGNQPRC